MFAMTGAMRSWKRSFTSAGAFVPVKERPGDDLPGGEQPPGPILTFAAKKRAERIGGIRCGWRISARDAPLVLCGPFATGHAQSRIAFKNTLQLWPPTAENKRS